MRPVLRYKLVVKNRITETTVYSGEWYDVTAARLAVDYVVHLYRVDVIRCELTREEFIPAPELGMDDDGEEYEVEAVETLLWW